MKVLRIVLLSNLNQFTMEVLRYLIDMGHYVYLKNSAGAFQSSIADITHNLFLFDKFEEIDDYDFCLSFGEQVGEVARQIQIRVHLENNILSYQAISQHQADSRILMQTQVALNQKLPIHANDYCNLLLDLTIDLIIALSKETLDTEQINDNMRIVNHYPKLIDCIQLLAAHRIKNDANLKSEQMVIWKQVDRELKKIGQPIKGMRPSDLEILACLILYTCNSRRIGIIHYDYALNISGVVKMIEHTRLFDETNQVNDLAFTQNTLEQQLLNNPFFTGTQAKSQVLIAYDVEMPSNQAAFRFSYGVENSYFEVEYPSGYSFIENELGSFISAFEKHRSSFHQGEATFSSLVNETISPLVQGIQKVHAGFDLEVKETISQLFTKIAEQAGDGIAIDLLDKQISYHELRLKVEALSSHLRKQFGAGERIIALYMDRHEWLVISLLAILRAGYAYLPLDLDYPAGRLETIFDDCSPDLILTDSANQRNLDHLRLAPTVLTIEALEKIILDKGDELNQDFSNANNLAYLIYTSGTTGKPKGVMIEHRALSNTLLYFKDFLSMRPNQRMLAVTTLSFDIAALELFLPLICGACIVITKQADRLNIQKLVSILEAGKIDFMQATPSLWSLIIPELSAPLKQLGVLCGGEALNNQLADSLEINFGRVYQVYGPTETTIWSSAHLYSNAPRASILGLPIANTGLFILDDQMRLLPNGLVGHLYISGLGLARGYYNNEALTHEKFITIPCAGQDVRLYKTGDLAHLEAGNGQLHFHGRADFQVKIRGHRIELGEIESAMTTVPGIQQALVVVARSPSSDGLFSIDYLIAYYIGNSELDSAFIRAQLASLLPEVMLPNQYIHLDKMPLMVNGKVDRSRLPKPQLALNGMVSPSNPIEMKLCEIWARVLRLPSDRANVLDDFFEWGGNSILAIKLMNDINRELEANIQIKDVFLEKNVLNLAKKVISTQGKFELNRFQISAPQQAGLFDPFPLTNVQQTYYLGRFDHFQLSNVSTHVYTEFKFKNLDISLLEKTFNCLLQRHQALRTVFTAESQVFLEDVPYYSIQFHSLNRQADLLALRTAYSHKLYKAEQYPLFDVFVSLLDNSFRLHLSFDALIVDMSSFEILFSEWMSMYANPDIELKSLGLSFRDYVIQLSKIRESELYVRDRAYWVNQLDDYVTEINLPLEVKPESIQRPHFQRLSKLIDKCIWGKVIAKAKKAGISPTAIVLEAYARTISLWSGQTKLAVNLTLFNRIPIHPEVNQIIGDFTSLELYAYQKRSQASISEILTHTHRQLMQDLEHHLFDGIDMQRLLKAHHKLPATAVISPLVLTSVLGHSDQTSLFHLPLNDSYEGVDFAISQTAQVWIDNKAYETREGFVAEWDYVEQLFAPELMKKMHATYCTLIERLAESEWHETWPAHVFADQDLVALINQANQAVLPLTEATLVSLVEASCRKHSQRTAVIEGWHDRHYDYGQLGQDSTLLGGYLYSQSGRGQLIGVLAEKGYLQAIGSLSVMKSGSAYLPLHVDWPAGRQVEVLKQGGVELVLVSRSQAADGGLISALTEQARVLVIEDILAQLASDGSEFECPVVCADDIAYVIFTSGSTGKPKGVTISHRGVVNTILAMNERFQLTTSDRVLCLSELSFDLSVYDLYGLLSVGGCLVYPAQKEAKEPAVWVELINRYGVSIWNTVPQLAGLLADEATEELASIRVYLLSGDWIPLSLPERLKQCSPKAVLMSLGGATEGSIWSIWYPIETVSPDWRSIPYGVAMPNQKMYVLNDEGQHCPIGVQGEIYIGGVGVALGYWRDEIITQRQFIHHPDLGYLYKTGDLGLWDAQGYMVFCGRADFQVKINGYRVELEEIGLKLQQHLNLEQAIVKIQQAQGRSSLVAYLYEGNPSTTKLSFSSESFKIEQRGLLKNLNYAYQVAPQRAESADWKRKSYRRFKNCAPDNQLIHTILSDINPINPIRIKTNSCLRPSIEQILSLLSAVAAKSTPTRLLPKFPYPSAGSSYSVQTFVLLKEQANPVTYYYHPVDRGLARSDCPIDGQGTEIVLCSYLPGIVPLYEAQARRLSYLEAGHMLALLIDKLNEMDMTWSIQIEDKAIDAAYHSLVRIRIEDSAVDSNSTGWPLVHSGVEIWTREANRYFNQENGIAFDLDSLSLSSHLKGIGALISQGSQLLIFKGDESPASLLSAGYLSQIIQSDLMRFNIGSCPLGYQFDEDAIYAMVLGEVDADQLVATESLLMERNLTDFVHGRMQGILPDYMMPQAFQMLENLPLSPNGKLMPGQLPEIEVSKVFVAPQGEIEVRLAKIWSEILGIPLGEISRHDNFFAIGGNSLSAIQLVRKLNYEMGITVKLSDLYQRASIADLVEQFAVNLADREEGEL